MAKQQITLRYSQIVAALRAIHSMEHGLRVYADGTFSVRHFNINPAFRLWMAEAKVALTDAHLVLDAYHQGLAPEFVDQQAGKLFEGKEEHYQYLWHAIVGEEAEPIGIPYISIEDVPVTPFVIRGYLLPLFDAYPRPDFVGPVTIKAAELERVIDALHRLEGKVVQEEESTGIELTPLDSQELWCFAHASQVLQAAHGALLRKQNAIQGAHRDADFMVPADKVEALVQANEELMGSSIQFDNLFPLNITQEMFDHVEMPADAIELLAPLRAPANV